MKRSKGIIRVKSKTSALLVPSRNCGSDEASSAVCREQEERRTGQQQAFGRENKQRPRMTEFPKVTDTSKLTQRNEGEWEFTIDVSEDGTSIELEVAISRHVDTALVQVLMRLQIHRCGFLHSWDRVPTWGRGWMSARGMWRQQRACGLLLVLHRLIWIALQADVQTQWVRMLLKGRLLQLKLPCEVCPNLSEAKRSKATGRLLLVMPRANPEAPLDITAMRPKPEGTLRGPHSK